MLLIVVRKRYKYQDQQRYSRKDHNSRNRKREQRLVKILIPVSIEVLEECIDMFSSLRHLCSSYACLTLEIQISRNTTQITILTTENKRIINELS